RWPRRPPTASCAARRAPRGMPRCAASWSPTASTEAASVDLADPDVVAERVAQGEVAAVGLADDVLGDVGAGVRDPGEGTLDIVGGEGQPAGPRAHGHQGPD